MKSKSTKKCSVCGKEFTPYRSTDKHCSSQCFYKDKTVKKTIHTVSKKRKTENEIYTKLRKQFLEGQKCFIDGCNRIADTVEHTRGRVGYADDWARQEKISLYLDIRYWKPCCLEHNLQLERDSELSKKYQLSKIHGGKK